MTLPVNVTALQSTINSDTTYTLRRVYESLRPKLVGLGIGFAAAAASYYIVPDSAVKTKQEIDEGTELSKQELMLRKVAVMLIVNSVKDTMVNAINIASLLRVPGVESKIRATAALLSATPSLYIAYKVLMRKFSSQEATLNVRELVTPKEMKTLAMASVLGPAINGTADGFRLAEELDKAGKLNF